MTQRHRIETYTGRFYDYDDPQPEQIAIEDIAHSLSQVSRFGGHTATFYSVAEHCVLVSRLLETGSARRYQLPGLLHDAHEAYLGDLPTPLKSALGDEWTTLAFAADTAIGLAFEVDPYDFNAGPVKWADAVALRLEAHKLKFSRGEHPEWDVAWEQHGLSDVALLAPALSLGDVEGLRLGLDPRAAEVGFLRRFYDLYARC